MRWRLALCLPALLFIGDAFAAADSHAIATLRRWLAEPEGRIDLARAKVELDHAMDPSVDVDATLRRVDEWVSTIAARVPANASGKQTLDVVLSTIHVAGPWNDHRPFGFDFTDPRGGDLRNTFLSTYLDKRRGQCVVMPVALVVIGQKLGLPVTLATAPYHILVKFGDDEIGQWRNVEATSGRIYFDSQYEDSLRIPPEAIEQGTFLRPLTQRESVALFATATVLPFLQKAGRHDELLQATDLVLAASPGDVIAMTFRAEAWYAKAEARGWRAWSKSDWERYFEHFANRKQEAAVQ